MNRIKSKKFAIYGKMNLVLITKIKNYNKVRGHCHNTGKYRGAIHVCNLRYKTPKEIPVVFHNSSKYDKHFIIKKVAEELKKIECL